jgi:acetolactate synthase small subunit
MRHTISVLVENKFGVLTRVAGLFSGRGYNIDTLNVAPTQDASVSRMTIVTPRSNRSSSSSTSWSRCSRSLISATANTLTASWCW